VLRAACDTCVTRGKPARPLGRSCGACCGGRPQFGTTPRGYGRTVARRSSLRLRGRCRPDWSTPPPEHARPPNSEAVRRLESGFGSMFRAPEIGVETADIRPFGARRGEKYSSSGYLGAKSGGSDAAGALARGPDARAKRRTAPGTSFRRGTSATIEGRSKDRETDSFPTRKRRRFASRSTTVSRGPASDLAPSCSSARGERVARGHHYSRE
jgi:hypothetical protein